MTKETLSDAIEW